MATEGFDAEFVKPPSTALQVKCLVCHLVLRDPCQVDCCGKRFCRPCIERVRNTEKPCPYCDRSFETFEDKSFKQELLKLGDVYCSNRYAGCDWTGELNQLEPHLNSNPAQGNENIGCGFVEVECVHCEKMFERQHLDDHPFASCPHKHVCCDNSSEGCQWEGLLGELQQHLNTEPASENRLEGCDYTRLDCRHGCGEAFKRVDITDHEEACPNRLFDCEYCLEFRSTIDDIVRNHHPKCRVYPVDCPNDCGTGLLRHEVKHHTSTDCPLEVIGCDFEYAGCNVRLARNKLPDHLTEGIVSHMSLQAAHYKREIACKNAQIEELKGIVQENVLQQIELRNVCSSYGEIEVSVRQQQRHKSKQIKQWMSIMIQFALVAMVAVFLYRVSCLEELGASNDVTICQLKADLKALDDNIHSLVSTDDMNTQVSQLKSDLWTVKDSTALSEDLDQLRDDVEVLRENVKSSFADTAPSEDLNQLRNNLVVLRENMKSSFADTAPSNDLNQLRDDVEVLRENVKSSFADTAPSEDLNQLRNNLVVLRENMKSSFADTAPSNDLNQLRDDVEVLRENVKSSFADTAPSEDLNQLRNNLVVLRQNMKSSFADTAPSKDLHQLRDDVEMLRENVKSSFADTAPSKDLHQLKDHVEVLRENVKSSFAQFSEIIAELGAKIHEGSQQSKWKTELKKSLEWILKKIFGPCVSDEI